MNYSKESTRDLVVQVFSEINYGIYELEERMQLIKTIEEEYGGELCKRLQYYDRLGRTEDEKACYKALANVFEALANYILDKKIEQNKAQAYSDQQYESIIDSKRTFSLSETQELSKDNPSEQSSQSKSHFSLKNYSKSAFLMNQIFNNNSSITEAQASFKAFSSKNSSKEQIYSARQHLSEIFQIVKDYVIFDDACRTMIITGQHNGRILTNDELKKVKHGIDYKKNNSKLIDQDIIYFLTSYFRPITFRHITNSKAVPDYSLVDLLDEDHIKSCLKSPKGKIDRLYTDYGILHYEIEQLLYDADLTAVEEEVVSLCRYHDMTQAAVAVELNLSQQAVSKIFNRVVRKCVQAEMFKYEDWYYLNIVKGKYKRCCKCGQIKLLNSNYYHRDSKSADGWKTICKDCRK